LSFLFIFQKLDVRADQNILSNNKNSSITQDNNKILSESDFIKVSDFYYKLISSIKLNRIK